MILGQVLQVELTSNRYLEEDLVALLHIILDEIFHLELNAKLILRIFREFCVSRWLFLGPPNRFKVFFYVVLTLVVQFHELCCHLIYLGFVACAGHLSTFILFLLIFFPGGSSGIRDSIEQLLTVIYFALEVI